MNLVNQSCLAQITLKCVNVVSATHCVPVYLLTMTHLRYIDRLMGHLRYNSFSTVLQSYQDHGRLLGVVGWCDGAG